MSPEPTTPEEFEAERARLLEELDEVDALFDELIALRDGSQNP